MRGGRSRPVRTESALPEDDPDRSRTAEIVRQMAALRQRRAQLLKENNQLRRELLSVRLASERMRTHTGRVLSAARGVFKGEYS